MMKHKILFYFLLCTCWNYAQKIELKDGDLIFQSMNCGELCDAINQVTEGYKGIDFNHMGMIVIQNDSVLVLEASGSEVKLTPLETFKSYTNQTMYIGRLKKRHQKLIPNAIEFGKKQLGTPYDNAYLYDNGSYYCSELIYDCFLQANGEPFFKLYPMTFKAPGSNNYFEAWAEYYQKLNIEIPEGKLGCNPGGISTSNKIKILGAL